MARWSRLERQLYQIISPDLNFRIHCRVYRMNSQGGSTDLPRYWITLDKEIIWDYPRQFPNVRESASAAASAHRGDSWPNYSYDNDVSAISDLLREYIDTPRDELLDRSFETDRWGLVDILRAADRRIERRQFPLLQQRIRSEAALKILAQRVAKFELSLPKHHSHQMEL